MPNLSLEKLLQIQSFIRENGRMPSLKTGDSLEAAMARYITSIRTKYTRNELSVGEVGTLVACDISLLSDTMRRLNRVEVFNQLGDKNTRLRRVYSKDEIVNMLKKENVKLKDLVTASWEDDRYENGVYKPIQHSLTYGEALTFDLTDKANSDSTLLTKVITSIEKIHEIDVYASVLLLQLLQCEVLKTPSGKPIKTYLELFSTYNTERLSYVTHRTWYLMTNEMLDALRLKRQAVACGIPNGKEANTPYTLIRQDMKEYIKNNQLTAEEKDKISTLFNQQYKLAEEARANNTDKTRHFQSEQPKVLTEAFSLIDNTRDVKPATLLETFNKAISNVNSNEAPSLYIHNTIARNHGEYGDGIQIDRLICKKLGAVKLEDFIRNKEAIAKLRKLNINSPLELTQGLYLSAYSSFGVDDAIEKEASRLKIVHNIRIDLAKSIVLGYNRLLKGYNEKYNITPLLVKLYCTQKGGNTSSI